MRLMKNKILLTLVTLLALSSCSDWLDVKPKSQVKDNELYSSEAGFKEALSGVYSTLVSNSLYVKELRFGMVGVLANEWDYYTRVSGGYAGEEVFDYTGNDAKGRIERIWLDMYNAIVNANVILEVIDSKKSLFTGNNYNIIKGEAIALRAFAHFDILRCFGVSWAVDPNKPAIPYVTTYAPLQSPQLTVSQVVDEVIKDLKAAEELLKSDPIYTGQEITVFDDNGYLINRQLHLNYYAVKGLQARVYLHKGDHTNAALCAREVINSGEFSWVSQANMIAKNDPAGVAEQIWGIDVNNLNNIETNYFSASAGNNVFSIYEPRLAIYYADEYITDDYRYLYLFTNGTGANATSRYLDKFDTPEVTTLYYHDKMTMIKLSEMYYILAECQQATGGDYLATMNEVRSARGLRPVIDAPSNFLNFLTTEFRKDFVGEGQLFFFYKRHNLEYIYGTALNLVDLKAYTFPLPDSELSAADRKDNR